MPNLWPHLFYVPQKDKKNRYFATPKNQEDASTAIIYL